VSPVFAQFGRVALDLILRELKEQRRRIELAIGALENLKRAPVTKGARAAATSKRSLGLQPLWHSKRCLRTAQDNYALDNVFALIEGHRP